MQVIVGKSRTKINEHSARVRMKVKSHAGRLKTKMREPTVRHRLMESRAVCERGGVEM